MMTLLPVLWPELLLVLTACALFLLGTVRSPASRRLAPVLALAALIIVFVGTLTVTSTAPMQDSFGGTRGSALYVFHFADYIKMLASGVGILLVLLAWPSNVDATGNPALEFGHDAGEFFALMLLSLTGVFLVAGANDIILLFLGIELASIPTYIMVSISRPLPVAQEAGVKYFFLGAMAAAIMLFGFSYLYGTTGLTHLDRIAELVQRSGTHALTSWQLLAVVMMLLGFAFKIAAVPLHEYAGDVYQGAATPVTAFLAFVPKTSGMIAIIKILYAVTGGTWVAPDIILKLLWVMAVLTMSFGNVLALLQFNIKRVLAYSSVAHTGYMLVGITTLLSAVGNPTVQHQALSGVLFYLAAYGVMNAGAFGVLIMLPSKPSSYLGRRSPQPPAPTSEAAETFDDIAGQGQSHLALGLAMAICCFSLTGLPLTVGFFGKFFLIQPAWSAMRGAGAHSVLSSRMFWLVVITMINAAVSAAYYLRIVAAMFLRPAETSPSGASAPVAPVSLPIAAAVALSALITLGLGAIPAATNALADRARKANAIQQAPLEKLTATEAEVRAGG